MLQKADMSDHQPPRDFDHQPPRYFDPQQPFTSWRKNLPHREQMGTAEFITFRLGDSMPQVLVRQYRQLKEDFHRRHPYPWDTKTFRMYRDTISRPMEEYIDAGYGSCVLKDPDVRKILVDSISFYDDDRFVAWAYVIMPNHVHLLATPAPGQALADSVSSIMKYSARRINAFVGRKGDLWQPEPFDTLIRSYGHYRHCVEYIRHNPDGLDSKTYELGGLEFRQS